MARLRIFLAWLLLAAIPLQGLAAAAMLHCGSGAGGSGAAHDHASHDQAGHAHAGHEHASGVSAVAADSPDETGALPDAGHKCSVCAACCPSAAISDTATVAASAAAPQAVRTGPVVAVHSRPRPVPDKPPRA